MRIKRTTAANQPKGAVWINDAWGNDPAQGFADVVHEGDYPTHSPLLGPDGSHLQYEAREPMGFQLRSRKT